MYEAASYVRAVFQECSPKNMKLMSCDSVEIHIQPF